MNEDLNIGANALRLLTYIYRNIQTDFSASVDCKELLYDNITKTDIAIATKYLLDKKYIKTQTISGDWFTGSITAEGIDWVEFCYKKRPLD